MANHQEDPHHLIIPVAFPFSREVTMTDAPSPLSDSRSKITHTSPLTSHSLSVRAATRRFKKRTTVASLGRSTMPYAFHSNHRFLFRTPKPFELGKKIDFLSCLPFELATHILSFLDMQSLIAVSSVSRTWFSLYRANDIWKHRMWEMQWSVNLSPEVALAQQIDWYHLYKQRYQLERRWIQGKVVTHYLIGHIDSVYCLQFDAEKIITGSRDRTIKFWDMATYQCVRTLQGHDGSVLCLKYKDDFMISGSSDTTIIVWDMRTGEPIRRLTGHTAGVLDVCFDHRYIISCSKDTSIRIWDFNTGALLRTITGHHGPVNALQLCGNNIVSASGDALIKMWDVTTGACIREFAGHTRGLACVQYDGRRIVSGSNDQTIKVWDAETGECLMNFFGHTDLVRTLHFEKDKIVSASYDQSIRVWDMKTGACLLNFQSGHSSWVLDVHFDKNRIVSASHDQRVLIMDFSQGLDTHCFS